MRDVFISKGNVLDIENGEICCVSIFENYWNLRYVYDFDIFIIIVKNLFVCYRYVEKKI